MSSPPVKLKRLSQRKGAIELRPVRPSAVVLDTYARRLDAAVGEMHRSIAYHLGVAYRAQAPRMAMDATPAAVLRRLVRKLSRRWLRNFDELAPRLAEYFAGATRRGVDAQFMATLREKGFTVKFSMTPRMRNNYEAVVGENVGLIKSIASEHLASVEGLVMRSVAVGGDLQMLTDGLEKGYGVTRRKAQGIARSQTRMATAVMVRTRQQELGVRKAKWLHSAGGKTPRPEHVAFSGQLYDVDKGHDFKNGEGIVWPGKPINCRCVSIPVIPGLEDFE